MAKESSKTKWKKRKLKKRVRKKRNDFIMKFRLLN
jgi:hypothetical protein